MTRVLRNGDRIAYDAKQRIVTVTRKDGREYRIGCYHDGRTGTDEPRAFAIGSPPDFRLPSYTTARVLACFYPSNKIGFLSTVPISSREP